jgi:hypothetical protein
MTEKNSDRFLISKQKLIIIGLLIIIFNPLPAGVIYGLALSREEKTRSDGKLMIIFSLLWGGISLALFQKYIY